MTLSSTMTPGSLYQFKTRKQGLYTGHLQENEDIDKSIYPGAGTIVLVVRQSTPKDYPWGFGYDHCAENYVVVLFQEKLWLARKH